MFPPYVVAAESRRPAPSPPGAGDPRQAQPERYLPVGTRHAVSTSDRTTAPSRQSLCGRSMTGWFVFMTAEFTGADSADCRRCEQVLRRRTGRDPTDDLPDCR